MAAAASFLSASTSQRIQPLVNHRLESGYRGVYRTDNPGRPWRAKGFRKTHVGNFSSPRAAAIALADHWEALFGSDWPKVMAGVFLPGWDVGPVKASGGGFGVWGWPRNGRGIVSGPPVTNPAAAGFRLRVWVRGECRILFPPSLPGIVRSGRHRAQVYPAAEGGPAAFATRADAMRFLRLWSFVEYGLFTPLWLRR